MLNALANHSILPHDGKGITVDKTIDVLSGALNLDPRTGKMLATFAVDTNPEADAHSFDLDHLNRHGYIEHDASLTRNDDRLGNNHSFDPAVWHDFLQHYGSSTETDYSLASKARYQRIVSCKKAHKEAGTTFQYGVRDMLLSYGETALYLSLLGGPQNGKIPLEYFKILVEQERVPYNEGWRRIEQSFAPNDLNRVAIDLFTANDHKIAEMAEVGLGTASEFTTEAGKMMQSYCTFM